MHFTVMINNYQILTYPFHCHNFFHLDIDKHQHHTQGVQEVPGMHYLPAPRKHLYKRYQTQYRDK